MIPSREFKAKARGAILALPTLAEGFTVTDVAVLMGAEYQVPGRDRKRLSTFLEVRTNEGLLKRVAKDHYRALPAFRAENAAGVGVELEDAVYRAFYDVGGAMTFGELLEVISRTDQDQDRYVRQFMDQSPRYKRCLKIEGYGRHWRLNDRERLQVPLPGTLLLLELKLAAGGRPVADMPRRLRQRRAQISQALVDGRELAGMTVDQLVSTTEIAEALRSDLEYSPISCDVQGRRGTLAEWWDRVIAEGPTAALTEAWTALESVTQDDEGEHLQAVSVVTWDAIGAALGMSAAFLSRGVVAPLVR